MDEIQTNKIPHHFEESSRQLLIDMTSGLEEKYPERKVYSSYRSNYSQRIAKLMAHLGGFGEKNENCHRVRVLSLGCGSKGPYRLTDTGKKFADQEGSRWGYEAWKPWMPRVLHELGFDVVGMDIGDLEGEPYKHFSGVNILDPSAFQTFPDHSFDVIEMNAMDILFQTPNYTSDQMLKLLQEIKRILKPSGLFLSESLDTLLNLEMRIGDDTEAKTAR